jgi:uncharacterized damage-inducible protein DinB
MMADRAAIDELIDKMTQQRDALIAQIESFSEEDASREPPDGEGEAQWSIKQQCAHLAEMETAYRSWVKRGLAEDNPDVTRDRGEPVAIPIEDANDRTVAELTKQLRDQRAITIELIKSMRPEDFERTATQKMFGTYTLLQWLRSYYRHDRMHVDQVAGREPEYKPRFAAGSEPDQRRVRAP